MNIVALTILQTIYVALPAVAANSMPPLAARLRILPGLDKPIDFGATFRGKRVFGDHKTFRGFVVGVPAAILIAWIQFVLWKRGGIFVTLSPLDFGQSDWLVVGLFIGLGTLIGDAVKSFFKRQMGRPPGVSWVPWDQLDSVVGALVFLLLVAPLPARVIIGVLVLGPALHLFFDWFGHWTGVKQDDQALPFTSDSSNNTKQNTK